MNRIVLHPLTYTLIRILTHTITILALCDVISFKLMVIELSLWKYVSMLNLFMFDTFSVSHSISQSVTGVTFYIFALRWRIKLCGEYFMKYIYRDFKNIFYSVFLSFPCVFVILSVYRFLCLLITSFCLPHFFDCMSLFLIVNYFAPMDSLSCFLHIFLSET